MTALLVAAACLVGLVLIPVGLPGLWLIVGVTLLYSPLTTMVRFGWGTVALVVALALVAEGLEWALGGRYARRYGAGRRGAWGALLGGFAGAVVGVPLPIVGSMIGGFVGAFLGALAGELSAGRDRAAATRAAGGALIGRAVAIGVKLGLGVAMAAWLVGALVLGGRG